MMAITIGGISASLFLLFLWRLKKGMSRLYDDMIRDKRDDTP